MQPALGDQSAYGSHALQPNGQECILIGHAFHPEVEGTMGQYDESTGGKIYLVESEIDVLSSAG